MEEPASGRCTILTGTISIGPYVLVGGRQATPCLAVVNEMRSRHLGVKLC